MNENNDIKVLEEFIDKQKSNKGTFVPTDFEITAIENLIARNKELEEKFKKMTDIAETLRKENVEYIIQERQYELHYIPKSKVREKIEERFGILCMQLGSYERDNATSEQERIAGGINELRKLKKELLQEGDK